MRDFRTGFPRDFLPAFQQGVLAYTYKGVPCLKCPVDLAIYARLIWDLRPGALIEIGSHSGGSALWFADTISAAGLDSPVLSIDREPPTELADPRITFLRGDASRLGETLTTDQRARLRRPWLVIEDSAHTYETTLAAVGFFASAMNVGDILVVEDGVIDDLGLDQQFHGGPNRAVGEFLAQQPAIFQVLEGYCDMFGTNVTYNPNGYLLRV